ELGSDGSGGPYIYQEMDANTIQMNGREVCKFAERIMGEASTKDVEKAGLAPAEVGMFVRDEGNIRSVESARERLGMEKEKMSVTVDRYGNTSAASIPLSIAYEIEQGKIKDNDTLVLVGFGGGLTWGAITLRWGK